MKKSIFLSVLALAAVVSCQKSEVVDTKFNEEIGFETYLGRDAQTKASVIKNENIGNIAVYGFYLGNAEATWSKQSVANLWKNTTFTVTDGKYSTQDKKYWTNDTDKYTFFAYAPVGSALAVGSTETTDPYVTFTVASNLGDQKDLVYSNNLNPTWKSKSENTKLEFKHALSRINVTATTSETAIKYIIKKLTITGKFNEIDNFNLGSGLWSTAGNLASESVTYDIFTHDGTKITADNVATYALSTKNFAGTSEDNYLMVIPTTFDVTKVENSYPNACVVEVQYTTWYEGQESGLNTKSFPFGTAFAQGKAYTYNLDFRLDPNNEITFTVDVKSWEDAESQPDTIYPEYKPAN